MGFREFLLFIRFFFLWGRRGVPAAVARCPGDGGVEPWRLEGAGALHLPPEAPEPETLDPKPP